MNFYDVELEKGVLACALYSQNLAEIAIETLKRKIFSTLKMN
jgi:hypothetical protein